MDVSEQLRQLRQCPAGEFTVEELMFLASERTYADAIVSAAAHTAIVGRIADLYARHLGHRPSGRARHSGSA